MTESLETYGLTGDTLAAATAAGAPRERLGRIVRAHSGRWRIVLDGGEQLATMRGRARKDNEVPAVGDWVIVRSEGGSLAAIEKLLARKTVLSRRAADSTVTAQVIVANVDTALVVAALEARFNERRLERFVALARSGGVTPAIVLSKCDLVTDPKPYIDRVRAIADGVAVHVTSATTGVGVAELAASLVPRTTYVLLGTSGAGKSSLLNRIIGEPTRATNEVRSDGKGRHTTTAREMLVLPNGALVIDTPGVREVGMIADHVGVEDAFPEITGVAARCRFRDCAHDTEPGCAVREAVAKGELPAERFEAFRKLRTERAPGTRRRRR